MGEGDDLFVGEPAELVADHGVFFVEPGFPESGVALGLLEQFGNPHAGRVCVAVGDQGLDGIRAGGGEVFTREAEIGGADHLPLAHRDAGEHLGEVFAHGNAVDEGFGLIELASLCQALCPERHLAQAFHVGRGPGEAVGGVLMLLHGAARNAAVDGDEPRRHGRGPSRRAPPWRPRRASPCGRSSRLATGRRQWRFNAWRIHDLVLLPRARMMHCTLLRCTCECLSQRPTRRQLSMTQ